MKIIENEEPITCIFEDFDGDICIRYISGKIEVPYEIYMTPLEAMTLSNMLKSVCDKNEYFKGFRKDD